jgi:hypothetical protein
MLSVIATLSESEREADTEIVSARLTSSETEWETDLVMASINVMFSDSE